MPIRASEYYSTEKAAQQASSIVLYFYTPIQISPIDSSYLAEFVVDGPGDQRGLAHPGVSEEDHAAQLPAAVAAVHPHRERGGIGLQGEKSLIFQTFTKEAETYTL